MINPVGSATGFAIECEQGKKGTFMFRKSALAMAMLGALTTGNVVALGLGEIELKSALNQPLNAQVELLSATEAELDELKVEVASPEAFANAGIERSLFLTKLKFDVRTGPDGRPVVLITSRDVVREPFLDFLLEVSWSKGRMLREYTVLIDPPVTMPAATPVPRTPVVQTTAPPTRVAQPPVTGRVTHTAQMPPVSVAPGEYLTRNNDTLWKVAQEVRPDSGVSIEQTMLGLQRANPEAFINSNINNLKAGYILRVPNREELTSISKAEASREARAQYAAWREARGLPVSAQTADAGQPAGAADAGVAPEPQLQLVAPDSAEAGSASGSGESAELDALRRELMMANEALEEQRRQGEEMSGRLGVLEEQIVNMQRLIQLKDDELAQLQSQVGEGTMEAAGESAEQLVAETEAVEATDATPTEETLTTPMTEEAGAMPGAEVSDADQPAGGAVVDQAMDDTETAGSGADSFATPVDEVAEQPPVTAEQEPVVAEPAVPETATSPGFVDRLLANPLWLGAGAAVVALLAFFGIRRRRGVESGFQESILQAARGKSAAAQDSEIMESHHATRDSTSTASSLLSEFAVSDMGSMRSDGEADPLAEADVYLAYGRYQQAEDLIKEALQNNPEHEALDLKLLEVYQAGKNQAAFDDHAQTILARLESNDDPLWEKVAAMGRELSPENPMYQDGGAAEEYTGEQDAGTDTVGEATEFDMEEATRRVAEASPEQAGDGAALGEEEGLDFDINLSFDSEEEGQREEEPDSMEFTPPEGFGEELETGEQRLDLDMDSLEPDSAEQEPALDLDLAALDLDMSEAADAEMEENGELADLDEVSTKLDLARAYIDMGDPDGAKSILDEVMDEGSDDQKDEARGILEQIS